MRVIEHLYEAQPSWAAAWKVRVWYDAGVITARPTIVATMAMNSTWLNLAERLAGVTGVNAVQVKYNQHDSILIYPDWP